MAEKKLHFSAEQGLAPSLSDDVKLRLREKELLQEEVGSSYACVAWLHADSKQWFTTSFLQPLPYLVTPQGPENCQPTSSFFVVGAQTVVSLLQTTQIISDVCFITDHVAYASSNKTTIV